ncbi:PREDICTED: microfibrillar-associated protein 5 isoform X1 [Crocodylus porosus]|uniref:microfibrillar-associated protein 5 isoform X1 n=1 Tax=Crocodylus porosus TaxID=8502 RepID=UPI00093D8397|nr:PREDICTED: microfibrillar-associated protein 5 isoform X1 [Crocodylus porosus]
MTMTLGARVLLCILALSVPPGDWFPQVVNGQDTEPTLPTVKADEQGPSTARSTGLYPASPTVSPADFETPTKPQVLADTDSVTGVQECREEQFPCTRLYSVHKPVKQCISYLCVTSMRRIYMINKEVCSRIICKENEVMQEELCRQLAGLPPRRLRRSGRPLGPPCHLPQDQQLRKLNAV